MPSRWTTGVWHYTRAGESGSGTGAYASVEGLIAGRGSDRRLSGWARIGATDPGSSRFGRYLGGGLVLSGPLPGRRHDAVGLAVGHATSCKSYRDAHRTEGARLEGSETVVELTLRLRVADWLHLQPDVQWIHNPDTDPRQADVTALGLRVHLAF
jgi:porin